MSNLELETVAREYRELQGLEAARARGRKGGRPETDSKIVQKAIKLYKAQTHSIKEIVSLTGISQATGNTI